MSEREEWESGPPEDKSEKLQGIRHLNEPFKLSERLRLRFNLFGTQERNDPMIQEVEVLEAENKSLKKTLDEGTTLLVAQNNEMNGLESRLSEAEKLADEWVNADCHESDWTNVYGNLLKKTLRGEK